MSAIYEGVVTHTRLSPARHSFRYRVFSLLLDLDEIEGLASRSRMFAHNRWGAISFHDKDHGDGRPLREWIRAKLAGAGIEASGRVEVLCYPRLWGFVFNPLSEWFCYRADGTLAAIVHEVHNTFGERHAYVLPANTNGKTVRQSCAKEFNVSPFLSMDCAYRFAITPPGDRVAVAICETERGAPVLTAAFAATRQAFSDRHLALAMTRHPLMTFKVIAAIHFEALRLWLKRVPAHAHITEPTPSGL